MFNLTAKINCFLGQTSTKTKKVTSLKRPSHPRDSTSCQATGLAASLCAWKAQRNLKRRRRRSRQSTGFRSRSRRHTWSIFRTSIKRILLLSLPRLRPIIGLSFLPTSRVPKGLTTENQRMSDCHLMDNPSTRSNASYNCPRSRSA